MKTLTRVCKRSGGSRRSQYIYQSIYIVMYIDSVVFESAKSESGVFFVFSFNPLILLKSMALFVHRFDNISDTRAAKTVHIS